MASKIRSTLATAVLALIFGFLGAAIWSFSGLADNRTRDYLMSNPDILPEMADAYQAKQARERLAQLGPALYVPFPGAVIGNPKGSKVLVEFTDYNCTYCRASVADVNKLVAEDPELMVVMREFPIFEGSDQSARMALAAAMQGKYEAFHNAMFELDAQSPEQIVAAAQKAGLDLERAKKDGASEKVTLELATNATYARQLGFDGTPGWVTKGSAIMGYIGFDALKKAINEASKAKAS
jgi:protein-disulfide isomerase